MKTRIVISGGPATGKTSIIYALGQLGHRCYHEISREIISNELAKGTDVVPWENLQAFSELVFKERLAQFESATNGHQFYDRSVIDTVAYMRKDGLHIPAEWQAIISEKRYATKVFITPPWHQIFNNDHERRESWEQLLHIHEYLVSGYEEAGYVVAEVPKLPVAERAEFILKNL
jgi:predicted ATPase